MSCMRMASLPRSNLNALDIATAHHEEFEGMKIIAK